MIKNIFAAALFLVISITIYDTFFCPPINPEDILCAQSRANSVQFGDKPEYFSAPSAQYIYWLLYQKNNDPEKFQNIITNRNYMENFAFGLSNEMEKENPIIQSFQQKTDTCTNQNRRLLLTYDHNKKDSVDTLLLNSKKYIENIIAVNLNRERHQFLLAWKQWAELGRIESQQPTFYSFYNLMLGRKYYTSHQMAHELLDSLGIVGFWETYNNKKEEEKSTTQQLLNYRILVK